MTAQAVISIHALLAESDWSSSALDASAAAAFLSTLSLRRATVRKRRYRQPHQYFYPRSPCGERHNYNHNHAALMPFLSTLSLRRATCKPCRTKHSTNHFYPRSPCGERLEKVNSMLTLIQFLSTLSLRRATPVVPAELTTLVFLSTLSLRRATGGFGVGSWRLVTFLSTLSLRRATSVLHRFQPLQVYFYPRSPCGERP